MFGDFESPVPKRRQGVSRGPRLLLTEEQFDVVLGQARKCVATGEDQFFWKQSAPWLLPSGETYDGRDRLKYGAKCTQQFDWYRQQVAEQVAVPEGFDLRVRGLADTEGNRWVGWRLKAIPEETEEVSPEQQSLEAQ